MSDYLVVNSNGSPYKKKYYSNPACYTEKGAKNVSSCLNKEIIKLYDCDPDDREWEPMHIDIFCIKYPGRAITISKF